MSLSVLIVQYYANKIVSLRKLHTINNMVTLFHRSIRFISFFRFEINKSQKWLYVFHFLLVRSTTRPTLSTTFLTPPPLFIHVHCLHLFLVPLSAIYNDILLRFHLLHPSVRLRLSVFLLPPLVASLHYIH